MHLLDLNIITTPLPLLEPTSSPNLSPHLRLHDGVHGESDAGVGNLLPFEVPVHMGSHPDHLWEKGVKGNEFPCMEVPARPMYQAWVRRYSMQGPHGACDILHGMAQHGASVRPAPIPVIFMNMHPLPLLAWRGPPFDII